MRFSRPCATERSRPGLLIHEGQLTYEQEGLRKLVDFGEWWAERTGGLPLPLGGNVIRRDLGPALIARLSRLLHDSIAYGLDHRAEAVTHAHEVRPRPRSLEHRHLRRNVRERPDARLRRARPDGGPASPGRSLGEAASSRRSTSSLPTDPAVGRSFSSAKRTGSHVGRSFSSAKPAGWTLKERGGPKGPPYR